MSNIYYEKENYDQSIYLLNKAIDINPFNELSYLNIANCYRENKEPTKSFTAYKKSFAINPKNELTCNGLGILFQNIKQYKDAISWYLEAISINSNNEWIYSNLARSYLKINDYNKARTYYIKAIKINPNNASHYNNLGNVTLKEEHEPWYLKLGNTKRIDVISLYSKAIELESTNTQFYIDLAYAYEKNNDYNKAIELYTKVIKLNPKWNLAYLKLGDCYFCSKDYDSAIKSYSIFIKQTKNNDKLDVYDKLMKCHFYRREFKMMIEVFKVKRNKIIFMRKIHQDKFKKEIESWFEDILSNEKYLLIGTAILAMGIILIVLIIF